MRNLFCLGLSLLVANAALATPAVAADSRFLVFRVCLQERPSTRCNDRSTGVFRFVGNSGGSWHDGHAFWPSGMSGDLVADRLDDQAMLIEMNHVVLPASMRYQQVQIRLVFRGSFVGGRHISGQYVEYDNGNGSAHTWYGEVPSVKDQRAYSSAIDQGLLNAAKFNADLKRKALNNMLCITSRLNDSTLACPSF
jgi:hypothetical protein